ncbi:unnamed protein product [Nesidiocoris tenuis]|uniref:ATP-dependent DNA ligase family profile domain-containing protein n=1 Tax=Nesidiocoris tenuis TaxID=355587 RepID=A0A6H5HMP2_9HEMI|nr:unnamed protein product [Nesidiocoris tenuis]
MADGEASTQYRWFADRAKTGRAACKKCKQVIEAKSLRMAKAAPSPFGSGEQMMKAWHHLDCMFLKFVKDDKNRPAYQMMTKVVERIRQRIRQCLRKRHPALSPGIRITAFENFVGCALILPTFLATSTRRPLSGNLSPRVQTGAQPCKSSMEALKKCPNGMYSEIKYDGERVQLHKQGNTFKYFSRSLKPVLPHKDEKALEEMMTKVFRQGLEGLVLKDIMVNIVSDSKVICLSNQIELNGRFSDQTQHCYSLLALLGNDDGRIAKNAKFSWNFSFFYHCICSQSPYEPGKRHWLKVKKDYLFDGAMADSADLVVLGAWYGTGQKGGMMSVFLMGCYDEDRDVWCTVTKVHTGHDDSTLARLQVSAPPLDSVLGIVKYVFSRFAHSRKNWSWRKSVRTHRWCRGGSSVPKL